MSNCVLVIIFCSHQHVYVCTLFYIYYSHSNGYEVESHCGFELHFANVK